MSRALRAWLALGVAVLLGIIGASFVACNPVTLRSPDDFMSRLARLDTEIKPPPVVSPLDASVDRTVRRSLVTIRGVACGREQDGSGWFVSRDRVVTNAHVVAGSRHLVVRTADAVRHLARIVFFDPQADVAVLRVAGARMPRLTLWAGPTAPGSVGAVYGHPGGGALRVAPARVIWRSRVRGTDIYGEGVSSRAVYALATRLAAGDSGAPLVTTDGRVAGMAFAIDPHGATVGYALTAGELSSVLADGHRGTAAATRCVTQLR